MSADPGVPSEDVPDPGAPPQRLTIDVETARRLVAEQFPQWSALPVRPVPKGGWDNVTFRLGEDKLVRMPSAGEYALAVEKEQRWLPVLAKDLPVPIPTPMGWGEPGAGYPFSWSIYGWLAGETADRGVVADPVGLADDVAAFIGALRSIDATGGPRPGVHNWYRGATLRTYDATARSALAELDGHLDVELAAAAWEDALAARWDGVDRWFHGDLAAGNLLLDGGRLTAVIDFGTCGVGDPSCDLAIAWTLLAEPGRRRLREQLSLEQSAWARGRGWALWKSLSQMAGAVEDGDVTSAAEARRVVHAILDDFTAAS